MNENKNENESKCKCKHYYWLKLKDNFFQSDEIKIIQSQENGADYILIYLKILLKTIKKDNQDEIGKLIYKDTIPYDDKMLSVILDVNIDILRCAMTLFKKLSLIEITEDGAIWMKQAKELVGSESDAAERMRKMRDKRKVEAKKLLNDDKKNENVTGLRHSYVTSYSISNSDSYREDDSINQELMEKLYETWRDARIDYLIKKYKENLTQDELLEKEKQAKELNYSIDDILYLDVTADNFKFSQDYFINNVYPRMSKKEIDRYLNKIS